jgi:hypothetical protein
VRERIHVVGLESLCVWSSAARTDALSRLPTDLQSRQPVTHNRQISARVAFAFAARYLTRPSWGREPDVHPVARWPTAPVQPICCSKAYSRKPSLKPTEWMTCNVWPASECLCCGPFYRSRSLGPFGFSRGPAVARGVSRTLHKCRPSPATARLWFA